jgi:hypothetical protein
MPPITNAAKAAPKMRISSEGLQSSEMQCAANVSKNSPNKKKLAMTHTTNPAIPTQLGPRDSE